MKSTKLIFALKEGFTPLQVLPQRVADSNVSIRRLYEIQPHIERFRNNFSDLATTYATDNSLFENEIYPALTDAEKRTFRTYTADLNNEEETEELEGFLKNHGAVEYVQRDEMNELYYHPNDPLLTSQWAVPRIKCEQAWDISQGDDIVVAVVDTGVDYNHPDMAGNMWKNAAGKYGYNFSSGNDDPMDDHGHGTHCSGTIAAVTNNNLGVAGIAPRAKIMAVKIFPNALDSICANAIKYAADNGARVISNSWGPTQRRPSNPAVESAIDYAYSKGCIVVFAAGNANDDVQYYSPANYARVINVAATDTNDARAGFSNYGNLITVAAPGVDINSLLLNTTGYTTKSGTSMACPHVAALSALILLKNSQYTFEKVKHFIESYGDPIVTDKPVGKRINAFASTQNSLSKPRITGVRMTFNLTSDDKDKEEEIQLTVSQAGNRIGYGAFGSGTKWSDPGSYSCTVGVTPTDPDLLSSLKIRMFKTPYGSATGCGMQGWISCDIICEGNLVQHWFTVPERRYGDNNPYDIHFPL